MLILPVSIDGPTVFLQSTAIDQALAVHFCYLCNNVVVQLIMFLWLPDTKAHSDVAPSR